jgi:hypothetical protein
MDIGGGHVVLSERMIRKAIASAARQSVLVRVS